MSEKEQVSIRMEFGLALPNGTVSWNEYRGHPTQDAHQRWMLVQVLRKTAEEIGFDQAEFLSCYGWVSRAVTTTISERKSWEIDSSEVCTPPSELPESLDEAASAD